MCDTSFWTCNLISFHMFLILLMSGDSASQVIFVLLFPSFHSWVNADLCTGTLLYWNIHHFRTKYLETTGHKLASRISTYLCESIFPSTGTKHRCQKPRVIAISYGIKIPAVHSTLWSQFTNVADGVTDRWQTSCSRPNGDMHPRMSL